MTRAERVYCLQNFLDSLYPETRCFLHHNTDYELLIAVVLSAQAKDEVVNRVTAILFSRYTTLAELAAANYNDVLNIIYKVGLGPGKAKNIIALAKDLIDKFDSKVPSSREDLLSLPGVGDKTASVIRGELFSLPQIPVDTHVKRIAYRLRLATKDDTPNSIETMFLKNYQGSDKIHFHRQMITFGRNICSATSSRKCEICPLDCCERLK